MSESYKGRTINAANDASWTTREIAVIKQLIDDQFMWEEKKTIVATTGSETIDLSATFYRRIQWIPAGGVATGDYTVTLTNPTDGQVLFVSNYDACGGYTLTVGGIGFTGGCGNTRGLIMYDNGAWRLMSTAIE